MSVRRRIFELVCVVLAASAFGAAVTAPPKPVTLEQYRTELQRIESSVEEIHQPVQVAPLHDSIPDRYAVATRERVITVENDDLKKAVGGLFVDKNREVLKGKIKQELRSMEEGAAGFDSAPDSSGAHARLKTILAATEFDQVRGPTLIEVWRDKILNTISRWWDKLMSKLPSPSGGHQEYTWILIAICACVLAIWLKRIYDRREPEIPREIIPFAPSGKHWRTWLAEARAAAQQGNWRDAIHLAYWAGISQLESSGAWTPDSARTPREYLRLIKANNPSRGELAALTRDFERIWYGSQPAGTDDFSQSLQHLERLGCR
jgi:hypothetical protein